MSVSSDYAFDLPSELVAQDPLPSRADSRVLLAERFGAVGPIGRIADLPTILRDGDLLVMNDSRVLPARLWTRRVETGGRVEVLLTSPSAEEPGAWEAMARPARRLRAGQLLALHDEMDHPTGEQLVVVRRDDDGVIVAPCGERDLAWLAERHGSVPLPPYIRRDSDHPDAAARSKRDRHRYQTVYARPDEDGASVAAPTAGLHFDHRLLERLQAGGVRTTTLTLHVGPGTFQPPDARHLESGKLHPEAFHLPAATLAAVASCRRRGGRVVAVGTTSLRVLATVEGLGLPPVVADGARRVFDRGDETPAGFHGAAIARDGHWDVRGTTRLFLRPPVRITAADGLITNFHLPESSLLMLVAAFAGERVWREAYRLAIAQGLRFYSYGDAMVLLPPAEATR